MTDLTPDKYVSGISSYTSAVALGKSHMVTAPVSRNPQTTQLNPEGYAIPSNIAKEPCSCSAYSQIGTSLNPHVAAKRVFAEALTLYFRAMRNHNFLNRDDKHLILIATHTLTRLDHHNYARALVRMAFSDLTASELLQWLDEAHHEYRSLSCVVPF